MSIHNDVGNTHLLLCTTHNNSLITPIISFPPTVNDTVFQISNTAEEADQKIIWHALHCIKVGYSYRNTVDWHWCSNSAASLYSNGAGIK